MREPNTNSGFLSASALRWAVALATLAASASLVGCASDNYYCDNTGCYRCDGVGCRPVTPPTRPMCTGDWDCPNGICTNLGCSPRCSASSPCPEGWVCRTDGICATPTENPTPNPGSCTTNAMCPGGRVCINGTCQISTSPACTSSNDCSNGRVCVSGRCTEPSNTCQFNNDCGLGRVCVNSACRPVCPTGMCPAGQVCVMNGTLSFCSEGSGGQCTADTQCPTGNRCLNGSCLAQCTPGSATSACPTDFYCTDDGVCAIDTRPRAFCDATHACGAGSSCVSGVCRVPCTTAQQCAMVDVSYTRCATIPNQTAITATYCLTSNEAQPACRSQNDCGNAQSCIDGQCR